MEQSFNTSDQYSSASVIILFIITIIFLNFFFFCNWICQFCDLKSVCTSY
uniref:Uncharacterized protein n=1 Tax=Anguilla anguilla TaxID=7936 RepID=A0A0E9WB45_ANGAN